MSAKVSIPQISANVEEVTLMRWLKAEGDSVEENETILEISTDKGEIEIEAPCNGTLLKQFEKENSTLPIGYTVAYIGENDETVPEIEEKNRKLIEQHQQKLAPVKRSGRQLSSKGNRKRVKATPAARRLAREHNLDLKEIFGEPEEKITESEVRKYLEEH